MTEAAEALDKALEFMSDVSGPPEDEYEQRLTSTFEHATRLAELAGEETEFPTIKGGPEDMRAAQLCAEAMQDAASVASEVAAPPAALDRAAPIESRRDSPAPPAAEAAPDAPAALTRLVQNAKALKELRLVHRRATLSAVATGELTAAEAIDRVDTVARFEALARHAWRSAAHLVGRGQ